ncbi:MAG TPA: nucleoside monophosphate kinase [Candidatus Paceibacterota bacterium]|nr:nucleoside monophosphate kinase [Candidatus Paceibacterota bacterium]
MEGRRVVVIIGPPGAGKGTQAELLAEEYGLVHLETSKLIEEVFRRRAGEEEIERARADFTAGRLVDPGLVRKWLGEKVAQLSTEGYSIVFSGSPRTLEEAKAFLPLMEEHYGSRAVTIVRLVIPRDVSIKRNSMRRICKASRHPIPYLPGTEKLKTCPKDGSPLITRSIDDPKTVEVRFNVYLEQTAPVMGYLDGRGYRVWDINGDASIQGVHQRITEVLESRGAMIVEP